VTFAARLKRCPDGERQAEARRYVCFASRGSVADCAWADDRCVVKSRKLSSGAEAHLFAVVAWGPSLSLDKLKSPPPKEFKRQAESPPLRNSEKQGRFFMFPPFHSVGWVTSN